MPIGRTRRRVVTAFAVSLWAAAAMLGTAGPEGGRETVVGGRLSHLCRAGLWVMGSGHVATGGLLMWLGC